MRRLTIKNVGPIKSITIDLKRINVLIGLQSSGKSTINKIACYCSWVEKEIFVNQSAEDFQKEGYFENNLVEFHKLEGFLSSKSTIEFETSILKFTYSKKDNSFIFNWKTENHIVGYKRIKTLYIPTERNIVAVIPNWFDIKLDNSNLRSFLSDWQEARNLYSKTNFSILNLGINYKYNQELNIDELTLEQENKKINFRNASSGLHSLVPLYTLIEYSTKDIFKNNQIDTFKGKFKKFEFLAKTTKLYNEYLNNEIAKNIDLKSIQDRIVSNINRKEKAENFDESNKIESQIKQEVDYEIDNLFKNKKIITKINKKVESKINDFLNHNYKEDYDISTIDYDTIKQIILIQQSSIFLEEPEINLFPITQRELVKYLVKSTYHDTEGREHSLFLTTHSPYILTTLNNLIYANDCAKTASEEVKDIIGEEYWVDFNDVGVWFVKDGVVEDILDYEERQIDAVRIDEVSQLLNNEFDNLLDTQYHEV
ncbi:hypothetical protein HX057_14100 [Myroides odoratimimus]|uniref:hypothetical protein n=1 Tax=Myroides odoratimimus TaxID=76832 RepID=UPI000246191E|nr:hypothetical protein [Myroides odoratimimus]EHO06617.1 hypothetical protein HMPREF9714_02910 [Myroides odoratimimus CCUG 12901]MDM1402064.1 hypothetical protein [Myroides odoratimimus]MDM1411900.1 hypothetical protein [Myroides odoratimimus]MDM1415542.1 hypothetical protein [Myroides odoratimimus]MDM1444673.1 hypothetical protein [Myroides odoratimimus]